MAVAKPSRLGLAFVILALPLTAACDEADPRITARVERVSASEVCLVPEDPIDKPDCYPYASDLANVFDENACVSLRLPDPTDPERRGDPITQAERLNRHCEDPDRS